MRSFSLINFSPPASHVLVSDRPKKTAAVPSSLSEIVVDLLLSRSPPHAHERSFKSMSVRKNFDWLVEDAPLLFSLPTPPRPPAPPICPSKAITAPTPVASSYAVELDEIFHDFCSEDDVRAASAPDHPVGVDDLVFILKVLGSPYSIRVAAGHSLLSLAKAVLEVWY